MPVWDGLLFGMLLQLSVGPVCMAVLQRSITRGLRDALWMVAGVALIDAVYMGGAICGLSLLLKIPLVKSIVLIGGAVTLIWFGIRSIRSMGGNVPEDERKKTNGSFLHGVVITLTNPLTILFWSGVFGSLMASSALLDRYSLFGFAVGCVLATLLFLSSIAVLGMYASRELRPPWIKRLNILVGIFLIGFAIVLLQNGWMV